MASHFGDRLCKAVKSKNTPLIVGLDPVYNRLPEPIREQAEIAPLQPNQQVTTIFGPLEVEPGGIYQVAAVLVITGEDSNRDDNQIRVQFIVNEG